MPSTITYSAPEEVMSTVPSTVSRSEWLSRYFPSETCSITPSVARSRTIPRTRSFSSRVAAPTAAIRLFTE